jgi:hypothetical protein
MWGGLARAAGKKGRRGKGNATTGRRGGESQRRGEEAEGATVA